MSPLEALLAEVRACRVCAEILPLGPRPVMQISATARILIAAQAPGTKVHASGIPFSDASGDRLRDWMGMSADRFYDAGMVAILPMGLCYPGRLPNGGDAPPRPECAPLWRARLLDQMPALRLTLLVGTYAQRHALGPGMMTERVLDFEALPAAIFPAAPSVLADPILGRKASPVRRRNHSRLAPGDSTSARLSQPPADRLPGILELQGAPADIDPAADRDVGEILGRR